MLWLSTTAKQMWESCDCYIYTCSTKPQQTLEDASDTFSKSLMIHLGWRSNFFLFCFRSAQTPGGRMWFCGSWVLHSVLFGAARYLPSVLTAGNEADSKFPRPQSKTISREAKKKALYTLECIFCFPDCKQNLPHIYSREIYELSQHYLCLFLTKLRLDHTVIVIA